MSRAQRFEVTVEGRTHQVAVVLDEAGRPQRVTVDDAPCSVRLGPDDTLRVGPRGDDGPQLTVHLSPGRRPSHAAVGGEVLSVALQSSREAALAAAMASSGAGGGAGAIAAPMPGRVVRVLVEQGQTVEAGAPLLIVEAMKMENEVRAEAEGVVLRIAVAAGDTVEAGQLLCELGTPEPAA